MGPCCVESMKNQVNWNKFNLIHSNWNKLKQIQTHPGI